MDSTLLGVEMKGKQNIIMLNIYIFINTRFVHFMILRVTHKMGNLPSELEILSPLLIR